MDLYRELPIGTIIEVYYRVDLSRAPGEFVWWPATVVHLSLSSDGQKEAVTGKIRYHARFGFRSSIAKVIFDVDGGRSFQDSDAIFYSWRLRGEEEQTDEDEANEGKEEKEDRSYEPMQSRIPVPPVGSSKETDEENGSDSDRLEVRRDVKVLSRKVRMLEDNLGALQSFVTTVSKAGPVEFRPGGSYSIPLKFLGQRLAASFARFPLHAHRSVSGSDRRTGSGYNQQFLSKRADCTLFELDFIAGHIKDILPGDEVTVSPDYEVFRKERIAHISFTFKCFSDLTKVFGFLSRQRTYNCILSCKRDKDTHPVVVSVIGSFIANPEDAAAPMYFTVAQRFCGSEKDNGEVKKSLAVRDNMQWTDVNTTYLHPLRVVSTMEKDVPSLLDSCSLPKERLADLIEKSQYVLHWKGDYDDSRDMFQGHVSRTGVLGTLEVRIPYFIARGSVCDELWNIVQEMITHLLP